MHLALVIPALNEQEAIAATLRRALSAAENVTARTPVIRMSIVFVNDGSTDRTQLIADHPEFDRVLKVRFEKNHGYGAAIKAGFRATNADLVGFMDADGTCDPELCAALLDELIETNADVVIATRLNVESQMPLVRKIGNILFARLLGVVSGQALTDAASGFRIMKRSSLRLMAPLPDGLHFTPAMSAICLLDPRLKIQEVSAPYKERIGRSKLSVVKDGLRFLFTILFAACCYAPLKTMLGFCMISSLVFGPLIWAATLLVSPAAGATIALPAMLVLSLLTGTGVVVHQLNFLLIRPREQVSKTEQVLQRLIQYRCLMLGGASMATLGVAALALLSLKTVPWPVQSNNTVATILTLMTVGGVGLAILGVINRVVWAVGEKQRALILDEYQAEVPRAHAAAAHVEAGHSGQDVAEYNTALDAQR